MPLVDSSENAGEGRRSLHVLDVASGELRQASPDEANVWEAAWCGNDGVVAIVSEGAGEGAWYGAELAYIDPAARTARTLRRTECSSDGPAARRAGRTPRSSRRSAATA